MHKKLTESKRIKCVIHTTHLVTTENLRIDNYVNIETETSCHCDTVLYPEESTAQMLVI